MREILFRGKQKENSKWVYGNYAVTDNNEKQQHFIFQNKAFEFEVESETVGQYTGLTDKNGKKIFEGDILKNIESDEIVDICYSGCSFRYSYNNSIYGYSVDDIEEGIVTDEFGVIGNIYDNPELLEV